MTTAFVLVIFGATGDLTQHKLIPVLFALFKEKKLPDDFFIVGVARREFTSKTFADLFTHYTQDTSWESFSHHLLYHQASFEDDSRYVLLADMLADLDKKNKKQFSRIYYLATPPNNYPTILDFLYTHKKILSQPFAEEDRFAKLAIEKPFGKDVDTARELDKKLADDFGEWQVFRVDHYLGKETVQNMLIFRFANGIFDPIWNNNYIDHVQITFAETKGIGTRGNFWEGVGLLRDVAQNHLMQLVAAVAMEMPKGFSKEAVRDARAAAIGSMQCIDPKKIADNVVRAQYSGYLQEKDVARDSKTETFVAMKFFIDTPRFAYVPWYIRAGKALDKDEVSVSVVFKQTCHILFKEVGCPEEGNVLTFRIQPKEGINLQLIAKQPGTTLALQTTNMHFSYAEQFKTQGSEAYEKILLDIFIGDQMLFNRSDELESSWQFITKILEGWEKFDNPMYTYEQGSTGPKEANDLIAKDGRKWI